MNAHTEIDPNADIFAHPLSAYLARHEGRFAVLFGRKVVAFFEDAEIACAKARAVFGEGRYSIRPVDAEPAYA